MPDFMTLESGGGYLGAPMNVHSMGDETILQIGGGYVGATGSALNDGYATVNAVNAPDVPVSAYLTNWIQQNKTAVYAGAGFLVLMAMFGRRGR